METLDQPLPIPNFALADTSAHLPNPCAHPGRRQPAALLAELGPRPSCCWPARRRHLVTAARPGRLPPASDNRSPSPGVPPAVLVAAGRRSLSLRPRKSGDRCDSCTGTHFTNTSGLIHRKRVFFSGKVVGLPTREPRALLRGYMLLTQGYDGFAHGHSDLGLPVPEPLRLLGPDPAPARRSMRTVRSNLFKNAPVRALDPPEPSGAVSEELTDSFVDVRLRELAAAGPSSAAGKAARDLLELSGEFSDYSSFSSDISGELERLAGAVPRSDGEFAAASALLLRRPELEEPPRSEALDWYPVERLEPVVRACVERLRASEPAEAREAAARLRLLAKHRSELRELIGASGAIPALVELLRSTDPAAQEGAATALLNLSLAEANKAAIAAAGAIKPLVYVLRTGTAAAKQNAACALLSLSTVEEHRGTIGACGAIPRWSRCSCAGPPGARRTRSPRSTSCAPRAATRSGRSAPAPSPRWSRWWRAAGRHGGEGHGRARQPRRDRRRPGRHRRRRRHPRARRGHRGRPPPRQGVRRRRAAAALRRLPRNRALLVREGAIPPLVALSQSGSARAKHKAEVLLGYLREPRHDGGPRRRSAWQGSVDNNKMEGFCVNVERMVCFRS
uniref:U-box domain-containing protein 4 n=1 Tax=Ananas comosus var. bracteatus TaxID=296719 RepID=A0A6V7Q3F4_ANACO|nr:unnamed protein product [Ananas comosus var. bracteatus]